MARSYAIASAYAAALALGAMAGGACMAGLQGDESVAGVFERVDLPAFVVTLATSGSGLHALAYVSVDVREDVIADPAGQDRLQEAVLMATAGALSKPGSGDGKVAADIAEEADGRLGGSAVANVHLRKITVFAPSRAEGKESS